MRTMRGRRWRWIGLGAGLVIALVVLGIAAWTPNDRSGTLPRPDASGASPAAVSPDGPVVYYEVLDAEGSRLMERRLDGHSLARQVAQRTDVDYGRTWTIDPAGAIAIAMIPGSDDQKLEAISIATGAALWSVRTPTAPVDLATWSPDGRWMALASLGTDTRLREALVIDTRDGGLKEVTIPDDAVVQGFEPDGSLILRQHIPSPQGANVGWNYLRVDPASATIERLAVLPNVGPASDWSEDVDPAAGLAVDSTLGANDQGTAIRLWSLREGTPRTLATFPSVDRIAIDPGGTGVAISAAGSIRFVGFNGGASDLFSSPDPIADFGWSVAGDYLAIATDRRGPNLTIVERATGRSVALPQSDTVAQLLFVRMVGGVPLPPSPLPAVEPRPTPTPGPAGPDVAAFDGLLSSWVDLSGDTQVVHVERLVPTEAGGLRVVAEMPPFDLGPAPVADAGGPELRLLPRPGSTDILIWIDMPDRSSGWLWDGAGSVRPLALPADWPDSAYDVAWRPDGKAIAASAGRAGSGGEFQGIFAIATLAARATTIVPVVGAYDRLEGWWSQTELRVGHGACAEGCVGRYSWSARLRLAGHRLIELTAADRARAPVDQVIVNGPAIELSLKNEDPADDIVIDWPASLGSTDDLDLIGFAADGRTLLVAQGGDTGTDLYRIDDPIGRATHGHLADPAPTRLAHLDGRSLRIDVSPDLVWATVHDRVDNVRLVRLADGRSWPVDRDRVLAWLGGG